MIKNWTS